MSHCVISAVGDTDDPLIPVAPGCVVHTHWAPCPLNGQPAATAPIHCDETGGRDAAIRRWELKTHRQRPLVLHRGTWGDERDHNIESPDCWCDPEFMPPVEVADA